MPVIVIGADTPVGKAAVKAIVPAAAEVRAFISDAHQAGALKALGVKVALGDVSDFSHVEAAALNCFCAVLVAEAATDGRERSFAATGQEVWEGWATAIRNAGLQRTIWVSSNEFQAQLPSSTPEVATVLVSGSTDEAARAIAELEEAQNLP